MGTFNLLNKCKEFLENYFSHLMLLILRLWIANIFWKSGTLKFENWDNTITLFTYEHPIPFVPPVIAAIFGTFFELICPILLALGFATRIATIPLLVMTAVIQFTYMDNIHHYYWGMILGVLLAFGPGKISLDDWFWDKYSAKHRI